jgi:hypothetical protein
MAKGGDRYNGWGPILWAATAVPSDVCDPEWPLTDPSLRLGVFFQHFVSTEAVPTGEFDLADNDVVVVELEVANQAEVRVGEPRDDYRIYRSNAPGSVGKVTSTFTGMFQNWDVQVPIFRIEVQNAKLGFSEDGRPGLSYPNQVSVTSTLYMSHFPQ